MRARLQEARLAARHLLLGFAALLAVTSLARGAPAIVQDASQDAVQDSAQDPVPDDAWEPISLSGDASQADPCGGSESEEEETVAVLGAVGKRAGPAAGLRTGPLMEMLSRRSALDNNFMRFGRSGSADTSRPPRADNFMRFGRAPAPVNDEFDRTLRGDNNSGFLRFGRSKDNYMRFGRAKDNYMRFGRAKDNYMRFGRSKDNYMRFGRSKDNYMRFGRAKDNYMRFGRAKDNYMRFGRAKDNYMRFGRAKDNYMRFGRDPSNFVRFGRSNGKDSFVRFGRDGMDLEDEYLLTRTGKAEEDAAHNTTEDLARQSRAKDSFVRFGRGGGSGSSSNFVRFGRASDDEEVNADDRGKRPEEEDGADRQKRSQVDGDHSSAAGN